MDTYTIVLVRRWWFNRKLKKVRSNFYPVDINPDGLPVNFMMIIFSDESREIVRLDSFEGFTISKELFLINAKKAKEESQDQANIKGAA